MPKPLTWRPITGATARSGRADTLTPAALVCDLFGGSATLARLLGTSRTTPWRWLQTGRIPDKEVAAILALAKREKVRLTEAEILLGRAV